MSKESSTGRNFRAEQPLPGILATKIFDSEAELRTNVDRIVGHLSGDNASLTAAVTGDWGAGKSSVLKYILHQVATTITDGTVTVSELNAPSFEPVGSEAGTARLAVHARVGLGSHILLCMKGICNQVDELRSLISLFHQSVGSSYASSVPASNLDAIDRVRLFSVLISHWENPAVVDLFADSIRLYLASETRSHLVLIDDLDRCSADFTYEVLRATNYWADIGRLHFVLAVRPRHLERAIATHVSGTDLAGNVTERTALEKYVHVWIQAPAMPSNPTQLSKVVRVLLDSSQDLRFGGEDQLSRAAASFPGGTYAPLLWPAVTPRALKHRLNQFLAELAPERERALLSDNEPTEVERRDDRRAMFRSLWPSLYARIRDGAHADPLSRERLGARIQQLADLGRDMRGLRWESVEEVGAILRIMAVDRGISLGDIDPYAVLYLPESEGGGEQRSTQSPGSDSPRWPSRHLFQEWFVSDDSGQLGAVLATERSRASKSGPADFEESPRASILQALSRKSTEIDPRGPYLEAQLLYERGLVTQAKDVLYNLAEYAESSQKVVDAPSIGDAALLAQQLDDDALAFRLHHAACMLDPRHANVRQNLADFLLDQPDLGDAGMRLLHQLLAELKTIAQQRLAEGQHPWRPLRTEAIELRIGASTRPPNKQEEAIRQFEDSVASEVQGSDGEESVFRTLLVAAETLTGLKAFDSFRTIVRLAMPRFGNVTRRRQALRLLADQLGVSDAERDEEEAIDVYWLLLGEGHACVDPAVMDPLDVMHNLATLISRPERDPQSAGHLWVQVYAGRRDDSTVRRAFSRFLHRQDNAIAASHVLEGRPLPSDIIFEPRPVPAYRQRQPPYWWLDSLGERVGTCLQGWPLAGDSP